MKEKELEDQNDRLKTKSELEEGRARLEAMKEEMEGRLASLQEKIRTLQSMKPDRPWLALSESETSAKRTIDTLRSGSIRPADPESDPLEMAGTMEARLQYWQLFMNTAGEFCDLYELLERERADNDMKLEELMRMAKDVERSLPSARIADAEERKRARRLHRARRAALTGAKPGRPRGGKR